MRDIIKRNYDFSDKNITLSSSAPFFGRVNAKNIHKVFTFKKEYVIIVLSNELWLFGFAKSF